MKISEYIAKILVELGTTDAFGIPGGVILDLIYAFDANDGITPHLCYHEQSAGFAACGYAQSSGKLGVAYATRGPGFTNLITSIADAYYDSLPVLFITAHAAPCPPNGMRVMNDQEMDTCAMVSNITKYAARLDDEKTFADEFQRACSIAQDGRKGPVFLDISSSLFKKEILSAPGTKVNKNIQTDVTDEVHELISSIRQSQRPVILIGDGINIARITNEVRAFIEKARIPVISSRFSHDVCCDSELYFGYVGSHGIRTANFILSKADLVISLGNRLHFPPSSESFGAIFKHAHLIRYDIDERELIREIPNSTTKVLDIADLLKDVANIEFDCGCHDRWLAVCEKIRKELWHEDLNDAVNNIVSVLKHITQSSTVVNDVGNHEFWVSRACVLSKTKNRVQYSKSFGALGCGLGKAIGTYYASQEPIVCFIGDQGLQINIQELQYISQHSLPIAVVLINNASSGMIKDREKPYQYPLHTTTESGFMSPNYHNIAAAYGFNYYRMEDFEQDQLSVLLGGIDKPIMIEISVDPNISLSPNLPRGKQCQDLQPALDTDKYVELNQL